MIIGPYYTEPDRCIFTVWAPFSEKVELLLTKDGNRKIAMEKDELGYWRLEISNPPEELRYLFRIDQKVERPDPASHFQPDGVHKPSQVINHRLFPWTDGGWRGIPLRDYIIYELHVGTFTSSGTFEAAIDRLGHLKELGVNVIELMPVAQFPGRR
ncbi:MAG: malto-oligosyltrehalose trehalohydrolase, partial [Calditrichaeota bacterium]|nr:malto-oligosyltrehalose trehalohydrolase [Calditrichota bacterium]